MNRRMMLQAGLALATAPIMSAVAQSARAEEMDHHHHHSSAGGKYTALTLSAAECLRVGQICLAHCHELLAKGEREMAACAASVTDMLATCDALLKLAASESKHLPKMASIALALCDECEKECRKHEKKHAQCRDCAKACADCAEQCRKVAA